MVIDDKKIMHDIVQWDVTNWSRAIYAWNLGDMTNKKVLGLGENKGGLSVLFALKGSNSVICSDYNYMSSASLMEAKHLHDKYGVANKIIYEEIDATNIPYEEEFDVVFFKSILGGIGRNNNTMMIKETFDQIYKSLKPGGQLYFVENLKGNTVVQWFRKKFSWAYSNGWNYLEEDRLLSLATNFDLVSYHTFGCIACIGPNETARRFLGIVDRFLEKFIAKRYIISCVLKKSYKE